MSPTDRPHAPTPVGLRSLERAGIGVVHSTTPAPHGTAWGRLEALFTTAIEDLLWNDFLVIEYDGAGDDSDSSVAWLRTGPGGVQCAVSGARRSSPGTCPNDATHFKTAGWRAPTASDQPWTSGPHDPAEAAHRVLHALRVARCCKDPYAFHWGTGTFPVPEGRTGTLTVIAPGRPDSPTDS